MRASMRIVLVVVLAAVVSRRATPDGEDLEYLCDGRRGRERDAFRRAVRRVGADRYGQWRRRRGQRRGSHHGRRQGRRPQADRHLITTHWHGDHFGGMAELAARIPIRHFIDHGPNVQPAAAADEFLQKIYPTLYGKAKHTVAKPGDKIPVAGLDWRIVTSAGEVIKTPLPGAGRPNPYCAGFKPQEVDKAENAQSVGSVITFGKFRVAHLGDLTWNKEFDLMCPNNRIGTVDLFVVSHHGQAISNSEALVHAIRPRVAIMNNGTRKGGQPEAMRILHSTPGLEDLWQVHFSLLSGQEYTVPGVFIANVIDEPPAAMPVAAMPRSAAGSGRTAAACPQRTGVLDQSVGTAGWIVHGDERTQWLQQDLQGKPSNRDELSRRSRCEVEYDADPECSGAVRTAVCPGDGRRGTRTAASLCAGGGRAVAGTARRSDRPAEPLRRGAEDRRRGRRRGAQGKAGVPRGRRTAGSRDSHADDRAVDVPDLFDDQAGHRCGRHDAARGGPLPSGRSRCRSTCPSSERSRCLASPDGSARRPCSRHHGRGSAAAHLGPEPPHVGAVPQRAGPIAQRYRCLSSSPTSCARR